MRLYTTTLTLLLISFCYTTEFQANQVLYGLPRFSDNKACQGKEVIDWYNIFNPRVDLQGRCGSLEDGKFELHCADTRIRYCNISTNNCVAEKPTGSDYSENHSLPTDEEYAAEKAKWDAILLNITVERDGQNVNIVCKPSDMKLPEPEDDCPEQAAGWGVPIPNFRAKVPFFFNSCSYAYEKHDSFAADAGTPMYCTNAEFGYCNPVTMLCQKTPWDASDDPDFSLPDDNKYQPANWGYAKWDSAINKDSAGNNYCFMDLMHYQNGTFLIEVRLWIAQ